MSVTSGLTFEDLRVEVGRTLGAVELITAAANGSTTTFLTDDLPGGSTDDYAGKRWRGTDAPNDGVDARVTGSTVASSRTTLTLYPAVTSTVSGDTAELWSENYTPADVHAAINRAIRDATGFIFDPTEDITLHTGGRRRLDVATTFEYIDSVYIRDRMTSKQLVPTQVWSESVDSDFTVTVDSEDQLFGRNCTKFVVASSISNGDLVSVSISSTDLSNMTHIEFPIKVDVAVAASDLVLRLSATANGADTDKIIAIPALTVGSETWVRVAMTEAVSSFTPAEATAIISVALEYNANGAANTIWVGDIEATDNDSYHWEKMPYAMWRVMKESRDLELVNGGQSWAGYSLLKLVGGDNPLVLSADGDTNEIPDDYVINQAVGHLLRRPVPGETRDQAAVRRDDMTAAYALAQVAKSKFQPLVNARFMT